MAKKIKKHSNKPVKKVAHHRVTRTSQKPDDTYLIVVRSWMLVVVFALMLGIGAMVGTFLRVQLENGTPTVAGASISR
jgi:hypothetical protein